jgi:hypothetical protein
MDTFQRVLSYNIRTVNVAHIPDDPATIKQRTKSKKHLQLLKVPLTLPSRFEVLTSSWSLNRVTLRDSQKRRPHATLHDSNIAFHPSH